MLPFWELIFLIRPFDSRDPALKMDGTLTGVLPSQREIALGETIGLFEASEGGVFIHLNVEYGEEARDLN